jgi:hypothetical protein
MCHNLKVHVSQNEDDTEQRTTQNKDMYILIPKYSTGKSYIWGLLSTGYVKRYGSTLLKDPIQNCDMGISLMTIFDAPEHTYQWPIYKNKEETVFTINYTEATERNPCIDWPTPLSSKG